MIFSDYIGIGADEFKLKYLDTGLVSVAHHKEFPLSLYTYGRKAVHEDVWNQVTTRCRGVIINRDTGEIIARPFEKFHNMGSRRGTSPEYYNIIDPNNPFLSQPVVWEKMDGFLAT